MSTLSLEPPDHTWTAQEDDLLRSLTHITLPGGLNRNPLPFTWDRIAQIMTDSSPSTQKYSALTVKTHYALVLAHNYETAAEHASRIADWEADMAVEKSRHLIAVAARLHQRSLEMSEKAEAAARKAIRAQLEEERMESVAMERREEVRVERDGGRERMEEHWGRVRGERMTGREEEEARDIDEAAKVLQAIAKAARGEVGEGRQMADRRKEKERVANGGWE